jgi:hypothetical protein
MDTSDSTRGTARYVFRVRFRVEPSLSEVSVDPAEFETTLYRSADPPGEADWLFFRDHLWRGNVEDEAYFREVTEDALGVPVVSVSFSELQTDQAYLDALRDEIGTQLGKFKADTVDEALKKYLGSSIRVDASDDHWGG